MAVTNIYIIKALGRRQKVWYRATHNTSCIRTAIQCNSPRNIWRRVDRKKAEWIFANSAFFNSVN